MKKELFLILYGAFVSIMTLTIHDARQQPVATSQSKEVVTVEASVLPVIEPVRRQKLCTDQVNLDPELQDWMIGYCSDRHISPCLVMALIEQESDCDSECVYITEREESVGLMQINTRWHTERVESLGVTDLLDPKQNIIVGVDYLLELFRTNPETEWVLNAYNGGQAYADRIEDIGIVTDYALGIMNRAKELEGYMYGNDE